MSDDDNAPERLAEGDQTTSAEDALLDAVDTQPPIEPGVRGDGTAAHDLSRAAARRAQAVRLRVNGATYETIARICGYSDKKTAWEAVNRALQRVEVESVNNLRALENARYDSDEYVLRTIIADPQQPAAVRIKAIDSRGNLASRRARLNGTNAPIQVAISAGVAADLADAISEAESVLNGFVAGEVLASRDDPPEDQRQEA